MATIPQRLIERARGNNADTVRLITERLTPWNYTTRLLDAILSHFKIENLPPKDTAHSDLASLFNVKPMQNIVACLSECLDNCYRYQTILAITAAQIHDNLDGILSWTAMWVKYVLAPETGSNTLAKQAACDVACELVKMLLNLSEEVDEVVLASRKVFDIVLWSWSSTYTSVESDLASSLGDSRQGDTPGNALTMDPENGIRIHLILLGGLTARYMNQAKTQFVDRRFVDYLTSSPRRLRAFATGFSMQLSKLRELVCNTDVWTHRDESVLEKMTSVLIRYLRAMSALQNRMILVPAVYRALRKAGFLQEWVYLLRDLVSTGIGWREVEALHLFLVNTLRMAYQPYTNPFSGLETVLEAGIHEVMEEIVAEPVSMNTHFIRFHFVAVYLEYANHPRGLKALVPAMKSIAKNQYGSELIADFLKDEGFVLQHFRARVQRMTKIEAETSPDVFGFCDNELHGSSAAMDGPRTKRNRRPQCSGCAAVFYCSEACQREDWKRRHRSVCSSIRSYYNGHKHGQIISSYRYRVLVIQLVMSKYEIVIAKRRSKNAKFHHIDDDSEKNELFPALADNEVVLHFLGGILQERPGDPVMFRTLDECLESVDWWVPSKSEECLAVSRARLRALFKSVAEKVASGRDSRVVVALWRYAPGYIILLTIEVEKDPQTGRYVHVQHVAELSDKFNDTGLCPDEDNLLLVAKDFSKCPFTTARRGVTSEPV
ncbi:hypothetical protein CC1G_09090 [Coprinopsis cinerea okayama7|uniref:MYND-type domain-containing protein n=1 Tax=Coprinopsis cinerea (strain Okayama-7 / 130 / ATCC MYA-4618 / FGSC 9003) TaxID=240176 RepID=A8P335_COPC7|nr:hypothetical protein CC1G_09090 [Coprinopsis cinerea okayama7\|eukprot:XP_001838462.2 hypothetical protein CC1G_09090 [Coprinopsis cinerea okayama7\